MEVILILIQALDHAQNRRHWMCVDGNGNRRKPGSEASVGCNEVKTWPTWAPVRHSHTRGRILWSFWEPVSALRQISNKDTNNIQSELCTLYTGPVLWVLLGRGRADGERKRFLLLRKPSPGVSNREPTGYWGYWVIHINMRSLWEVTIGHILSASSHPYHVSCSSHWLMAEI